LVAGDLHGDPFRHTKIDHIADGGPAEIMAQHPHKPHLYQGDVPDLAKVPAAFPLKPACHVRKEIRGEAIQLSR
jgi:hypothetical protein